MLTRSDLKQIEGIVSKSIKAAFADFYESIFEPNAERNEREHAEIRKDLVEIKEHIKDHSKRLEKVEALTALKN
ncbi:MAG: hypothetical protein HY428_00965 [Candidatus Levybacteria bacterium]|nr:hypothetical protein [Candidatus Levybacteria bacterium]